MSTLLPGDLAPDFRLPCDGGDVSLTDFRGRKLVVFFYPKADTPGCTSEANDFSARAPAFAQAETALLGISADSPKRQAAFKAKYGLALPLASDETHEMLAAYGVWGEKSMYGKKYMGITRTTVLIDRDGRIARTWPKVKIAGHADEVLAAAMAL
jgi:peroxiredoxin Q/BCP